MADHRLYRLTLSPEKVLERLRSSGQNALPYEVTIVGNRFFLAGGSPGPSLAGAVLEEEGGSCIDLRLSLRLAPTLTVLAFGMLLAQLAIYSSVLDRGPLISFKVRAVEALRAIGCVAIALLVLCLAWRARRRRAPALWAFLDRLFADVKFDEEQL